MRHYFNIFTASKRDFPTIITADGKSPMCRIDRGWPTHPSGQGRHARLRQGEAARGRVPAFTSEVTTPKATDKKTPPPTRRLCQIILQKSDFCHRPWQKFNKEIFYVQPPLKIFKKWTNIFEKAIKVSRHRNSSSKVVKNWISASSSFFFLGKIFGIFFKILAVQLH
jgi:hypothetical protein